MITDMYTLYTLLKFWVLSHWWYKLE